MSETDIYKNREPMPYSEGKSERTRHRRHSTHQRSFDDHTRKRRSRNSGLRRLLHLYRKKESEKIVWLSMLVLTVLVLLGIALWQYVIMEHRIRIEEEKNASVQTQMEAEQTEPSAAE